MSYVQWDNSWSFVTYSTGTDWSSRAIGDEAVQTSDSISLDEKFACEISIQAEEDNTGACDGSLYVYLLRDLDGTNYEDFTSATDNDNPQLLAHIDAEQNKTRSVTVTVLAEEASAFKLALDNDSGQSLDVTIKYKTAVLET